MERLAAAVQAALLERAGEVGEEVDAQPGDDALGGGREQEDLDEVERGLHGEEPEQSQRDAVEPRGAAIGEG